MSRIFIALLLATAWIDGHAQSSLPPCPTDTSVVWTNCFGTYAFVSGGKYVGEWKGDQQYGRGSLISPKGYTVAEGIWLDDFTVISSGGRWFKASISDDTTFFVSTESIRQEGVFRRAWVIYALSAPEPQGEYLSSKLLTKFDCADERTKFIAGSGYSGPFGTGKVIVSLDERDWDYVPPGSAISVVMKYVCDYKLTPKK